MRDRHLTPRRAIDACILYVLIRERRYRPDAFRAAIVNGETMVKALIALLVLSGFYLMTGKVYSEGGFGVDLVVKPGPSFVFEFGGGEEGSWRRSHPGDASPWWQGENFIRIIKDDWEGGTPLWEYAYDFGLRALLVGWFVLGLTWTARYLLRRRANGQR
jgi:hypothetical protein